MCTFRRLRRRGAGRGVEAHAIEVFLRLSGLCHLWQQVELAGLDAVDLADDLMEDVLVLLEGQLDEMEDGVPGSCQLNEYRSCLSETSVVVSQRHAVALNQIEHFLPDLNRYFRAIGRKSLFNEVARRHQLLHQRREMVPFELLFKQAVLVGQPTQGSQNVQATGLVLCV